MANNTQFGAFVPTTDVFDTTIGNLDPQSDEFKYFLVRLRQSINNIALVLNIKDSGYYLPTEFVNGQLYFPNPLGNQKTYRQVFRDVVDFGALPNTGTKSVPHTIENMNDEFTFTRIYGAATDPVNLIGIPVPNLDAIGFVYISVDDTNINITTTFDATAYTRCLVVVEYLKN